jgi:signal peptidase I
MTARWFFSKTVRQATAMRKHVQKLLNHQRDILSAQAIEGVKGGIRDLQNAIDSKVDNAGLEKQMESMEKTANKWLKPYPNAAWRENVEVLLVALSVAMGIRTFFLQPFKIPTGSMQPTLYGVTHENLIDRPEYKFPTGWERVREWFKGVSYVHVVAKNDGRLRVDQPLKLLIFSIKQTLWIGDTAYTLWFPPDFGAPPAGTLEGRADLHNGQEFHSGDEVVKLRVRAGDHLFVNRLAYNFRVPKRGEIVVFDTRGITRLDPEQQNTFYIKRLCGLGGETLSLKPDYTVVHIPNIGTAQAGHLVVNGKELSASTAHFENVYSFYGAGRGTKVLEYQDYHYFGHGLLRELGPGQEVHVADRHYFVMGDNTFNSSDSRFWGDFPVEKVIGKSFFVYWPLSERFGWGTR